jgi:hypothetical protein
MNLTRRYGSAQHCAWQTAELLDINGIKQPFLLFGYSAPLD